MFLAHGFGAAADALYPPQVTSHQDETHDTAPSVDYGVPPPHLPCPEEDLPHEAYAFLSIFSSNTSSERQVHQKDSHPYPAPLAALEKEQPP